MTQQMVVDELRAQGDALDASYYRALESGAKTPGQEMRDALGRYFGRTPPTPARRGEATDLTRLTAAIEAQTAAITRLIEVLGDRDDPVAQAEVLGEALATHLAPLLSGVRDGRPSGAQQ